ncbi:hypothetical protein AB0D62_14625 [Streptomyces massasporeus]|uniref:hypothetical protein n=1 Tax=Streptomyces massasporeus TaxID=67324 RepID=UPI0033C89DD5
MIIVLELRVYPLFAFLFGYGMMQLYLRQTAAGTDGRAAAKVLRRRSLWLIVIGLTHATLLMAGDVTGFYGVLSLVLGLAFLRRGRRACPEVVDRHRHRAARLGRARPLGPAPGRVGHPRRPRGRTRLVAGAYARERTGRRGPAEVMLRRLTYGSRGV